MHVILQNLVEIDDAGIHATYFLSPDNVMLKLHSYAHTEFDRWYAAAPMKVDFGKLGLRQFLAALFSGRST